MMLLLLGCLGLRVRCAGLCSGWLVWLICLILVLGLWLRIDGGGSYCLRVCD